MGKRGLCSLFPHSVHVSILVWLPGTDGMDDTLQGRLAADWIIDGIGKPQIVDIHIFAVITHTPELFALIIENIARDDQACTVS